MEKITGKLYSWASILEQDTRAQACRAASMSFIYPHMALMPDAHLGKGATVGSVIPTLGAIIPAAVGVDIGCFHGDMRIPLLSGRQESLRELTARNGTYWVYSLNDQGNIVPGRAAARRTRTDAELMKVVISGGEEIICTPDHLFMMNDGSYSAASELKPGNSLMSLYRKTRDGYESISTGRGTARPTHIQVYESLNGKVPAGRVVHHENHMYFDNTPENLRLLGAGEHARHHRRANPSFDNSSPEFQEKRLAGIRRSLTDPVAYARKVATATANITRYMAEQPDHFREAVAGNGKRGAPYLAAFNRTPRVCSDCNEETANPAALRWHKKREHDHNHKVIAVEPADGRADVYCLQVEEYHNFALAAGVFVHNCGMQSVRTQYSMKDVMSRGDLTSLRVAIEKEIPLSAGKYNDHVRKSARPRVEELEALPGAKQASAVSPNWHLQLGSLGSGNHFCEVSKDEQDRVWLFLHSGSRGVGNKLATGHIKVAHLLCKGVALPDRDLAYLTEGTQEFSDYIRDLRWAQHFALLNREEMMDRMISCFSSWIGGQVRREETVQCHHNYTVQETHGGKEVWLSRKGAIDAHEGVPGLIPGSMGDESFVVTGKGNEMSLHSSPHGAGRNYSRGLAKRTFTMEQLEHAMKGIEWRHTAAFLDEYPAAYKPIRTVMEDAADLVEIRHTLRQFVNIKGDLPCHRRGLLLQSCSWRCGTCTASCENITKRTERR